MATAYACRRTSFGKLLIDHEDVGFMFAENLIDLQRWASMIDWCADVLDTGVLGTSESSMAKVAVPEVLSRTDACR
nr:acyl-CoA dehydrogenase family protein [uncultured Lichenicoccus sp.]